MASPRTSSARRASSARAVRERVLAFKALRSGGQVSRLRKLWESSEMEIVSVIEATNRLRERAEFELHALVEKKPEMFESVVARRTQKENRRTQEQSGSINQED